MSQNFQTDRIGIGTSNPTAPLYVADSGYIATLYADNIQSTGVTTAFTTDTTTFAGNVSVGTSNTGSDPFVKFLVSGADHTYLKIDTANGYNKAAGCCLQTMS